LDDIVGIIEEIVSKQQEGLEEGIVAKLMALLRAEESQAEAASDPNSNIVI
jgi:hypothetical protein